MEHHGADLSVQGALVLLSDVWVTLFHAVLFRSFQQGSLMSGPSRRDQNNILNDHTLEAYVASAQEPEYIRYNNEARWCFQMQYHSLILKCWQSLPLNFSVDLLCFKAHDVKNRNQEVTLSHWCGHTILLSVVYNDSMSIIVFVKTDEGRRYKINKRLELSGMSSLSREKCFKDV